MKLNNKYSGIYEKMLLEAANTDWTEKQVRSGVITRSVANAVYLVTKKDKFTTSMIKITQYAISAGYLSIDDNDNLVGVKNHSVNDILSLLYSELTRYDSRILPINLDVLNFTISQVEEIMESLTTRNKIIDRLNTIHPNLLRGLNDYNKIRNLDEFRKLDNQSLKLLGVIMNINGLEGGSASEVVYSGTKGTDLAELDKSKGGIHDKAIREILETYHELDDITAEYRKLMDFGFKKLSDVNRKTLNDLVKILKFTEIIIDNNDNTLLKVSSYSDMRRLAGGITNWCISQQRVKWDSYVTHNGYVHILINWNYDHKDPIFMIALLDDFMTSLSTGNKVVNVEDVSILLREFKEIWSEFISKLSSDEISIISKSINQVARFNVRESLELNESVYDDIKSKFIKSGKITQNEYNWLKTNCDQSVIYFMTDLFSFTKQMDDETLINSVKEYGRKHFKILNDKLVDYLNTNKLVPIKSFNIRDCLSLTKNNQLFQTINNSSDLSNLHIYTPSVFISYFTRTLDVRLEVINLLNQLDDIIYSGISKSDMGDKKKVSFFKNLKDKNIERTPNELVELVNKLNELIEKYKKIITSLTLLETEKKDIIKFIGQLLQDGLTLESFEHDLDIKLDDLNKIEELKKYDEYEKFMVISKDLENTKVIALNQIGALVQVSSFDDMNKLGCDTFWCVKIQSNYFKQYSNKMGGSLYIFYYFKSEDSKKTRMLIGTPFLNNGGVNFNRINWKSNSSSGIKFYDDSDVSIDYFKPKWDEFFNSISDQIKSEILNNEYLTFDSSTDIIDIELIMEKLSRVFSVSTTKNDIENDIQHISVIITMRDYEAIIIYEYRQLYQYFINFNRNSNKYFIDEIIFKSKNDQPHSLNSINLNNLDYNAIGGDIPIQFDELEIYIERLSFTTNIQFSNVTIKNKVKFYLLNPNDKWIHKILFKNSQVHLVELCENLSYLEAELVDRGYFVKIIPNFPV